NWKSDPNVSVKIGEQIELASWQKSPFEPLTGRGSDRGVRTYIVPDNQPYRPRLKAQLSGVGVKGNTDFNANFDNLEILSQTIYPEVVGNAIKSEIKHYSAMKHIDFIKEASDSLTEWIQAKRDRGLVCALSNDFSNVVVCDQQDGFKTPANTNDPVENLTQQIAQGDTMSVKAIRRAIFQARAGVKHNNTQAFPLKPIRSEMVSTGGVSVQNYSYIILLDSFAINQLKADPEYQEMQKFAGLRGDKNALFSGLIGLIDNCPVIDMGVWTSVNVGLLNSDVSDDEFKANINAQNHTTLTPPSFYAGGTPLSIGALIGASALVLAGNAAINFYINETEDAGRKTICGVDRILGISKARFTSANGINPIYDNSDFAVIGLFSSKE
ncbi:phage capsid family protein, partial [Helicobacter bizzozeronii]|uniref:phage capsid family protein n=1 Tax=Helicobacter bizzozeronii TaxID=56877 RepID=UPI000CF12224